MKRRRHGGVSEAVVMLKAWSLSALGGDDESITPHGLQTCSILKHRNKQSISIWGGPFPRDFSSSSSSL